MGGDGKLTPPGVRSRCSMRSGRARLWSMAEGDRVRLYEALLLDFWGVLTTDLFGAYGRFCEEQGLPRAALCDLLTEDEWGHGLLMDLERGMLGQREFEQAVAARLGIDGSRLVEKVMEYLRPEPLLMQFAERARRSGILTGVLSNSLGMEPYDPYGPWRLKERFDVVVISGEARMRKPDPEIFTLALDRLGVAPAACVFVDDMAHNLEAARALGMTTVHHTDPERTVGELKRLLAL
jgi:putative hydrolase of the HAD superfamily